MFQFSSRFKMDLLLVTDGGVEGAGVGTGVSDKGSDNHCCTWVSMWHHSLMISGRPAFWVQNSRNNHWCTWVSMWHHSQMISGRRAFWVQNSRVENSTSLYEGLKRLTKFEFFNSLTATQINSYGHSWAPTFRQASLVIGNFKDFCPLLAFDS